MSTAPFAGGAAADGGTGAHAGTFARLALDNITRAYPHFPGHLLAGPQDLVEPRVHHPAFHGAYDWHSAVHMHWLALRMLRRHGARDAGGRTEQVLDAHLSPDALAAEAAYLRAHPSFERPYGWAWLIALTAEAAAHPDRSWSEALAPIARTVAGLFADWLPKARYPVRHGTHANSAFALGLVLDSARDAGVPELEAPVAGALRTWFLGDAGASLRFEPSGQDFLSPLLSEADAMRRVLTPSEFAGWFRALLPELAEAAVAGRPLLEPPEVTDPADPQIGHLYGLCFSRAAALEGIAGALASAGVTGPLPEALRRAAEAHREAGMEALASGDFTTDHWLATFAVLALESARGGAGPRDA